jgi:hypothetical protein
LLRGHGARAGQGFEHGFTRAAAGTFPILRQVFKPGARGNFPLLISSGRVVNVAAIARLALPHIFGLGHFFLPSGQLLNVDAQIWELLLDSNINHKKCGIKARAIFKKAIFPR